MPHLTAADMAEVPHTHEPGDTSDEYLRVHRVTHHRDHPDPLVHICGLARGHARWHPEYQHWGGLWDPDPAATLAVAEDERHTLLAQAARQHIKRLAAEMRMYEQELQHIENVFRDRTASQAEMPEWVTDARKADIAAALRIVDAASLDDTTALITRAGLTAIPGQLRRILAEAASEPSKVYPAWQAATAILKAAGR